MEVHFVHVHPGILTARIDTRRKYCGTNCNKMCVMLDHTVMTKIAVCVL